jgi:hypothetical protein
MADTDALINRTAQERANKYIIDVIEQYLPAGVNYIIVDENMNPIKDIRKTF